jgi:hypothetical protein
MKQAVPALAETLKTTLQVCAKESAGNEDSFEGSSEGVREGSGQRAGGPLPLPDGGTDWGPVLVPDPALATRIEVGVGNQCPNPTQRAAEVAPRKQNHSENSEADGRRDGKESGMREEYFPPHDSPLKKHAPRAQARGAGRHAHHARAR